MHKSDAADWVDRCISTVRMKINAMALLQIVEIKETMPRRSLLRPPYVLRVLLHFHEVPLQMILQAPLKRGTGLTGNGTDVFSPFHLPITSEADVTSASAFAELRTEIILATFADFEAFVRVAPIVPDLLLKDSHIAVQCFAMRHKSFL